MKRTQVVEWVLHRWVQLTTLCVLSVALATMYLYRLTDLIPGMNSYEARHVAVLESIGAPWQNPVNWPYIALARIVTYFGVTPLFALKLVSVCAGLLSVIMFYYLLRNWLFSSGKALVGTILFATSSWQLAVTRGGYGITFASLLLIIFFMSSTRVLYSTKPFFDWLLLIICGGLALYSPLVAWFVFVGAAAYIVQTKGKVPLSGLDKKHIAILFAVALFMTMPLLIGLVVSDDVFKQIFIGGSASDVGLSLFAHIAESISVLFFRTETISPITLGSLPLLDIFSVLMFMLGLYYFERRLALRRSRMILGSLCVGLVVASLSGFSAVQLSVLTPIIYVVIAAGTCEMISRWLAVFPKNPVARSTGIIMIALVVGFVGNYHLTKHFVARTGNPEIRSLYQ